MKKLTLMAITCYMVGLSNMAAATWIGKLDLDPVVSPIMIRELHDGQWLAGVTKENIWHLDQNGVQRAHAGVFQAWNAEHGNASTGMVVGIDVPVSLAESVGALAKALNLEAVFKPIQYASAALSLDAIGGYRPLHSADVNGPWVYGLGARLNIAFGVRELAKGL